MKKNLLIIASIAAAISFASCNSEKKTTEEAATEVTEAVETATEAAAEAAQKIEDFTTQLGTYEGTIAQADGAGYLTTITFNPDMTYTLTSIADAGQGTKEESNGTFAFDVASQKLTLTDAKDAKNVKVLAVEGNNLIFCTPEGNMPEVKEMYTIVRK